MKTFLSILVLLAATLSAQEQNPYTITTPTWYNESGGKVTAIASGDTIVSNPVQAWDVDQVSLVIPGAFGDTVHFNGAYQLGFNNSSDTTNSFYKGGFKAFVIVDSLANNGARAGGVCVVSYLPHNLKHSDVDGKQSLTGDSTTYNYGVVVNQNQAIGATHVRFVLVGYVGNGSVGGETTLLSRARIITRRFLK